MELSKSLWRLVNRIPDHSEHVKLPKGDNAKAYEEDGYKPTIRHHMEMSGAWMNIAEQRRVDVNDPVKMIEIPSLIKDNAKRSKKPLKKFGVASARKRMTDFG